MIYSVWNQGALAFDYFEVPGADTKVNAPAPKHLRQSKLGLTVRQSGWPLPSGAIHRGQGPLPQGRIASTSGDALGDITLGSAAVIVGAGLVVMYLVMR